LAGNQNYEVTGGEVIYGGKNLLDLATEDRAREGVFLAFQYPVEIPGVIKYQFFAYCHERDTELPQSSCPGFKGISQNGQGKAKAGRI
jgi:Fe-S cluster assembly ATPase SufC